MGDLGGDVINTAGQVARGAVKGAAEIGTDVALVARRAVDGIVEAVQEVGGDVGGAATAAVNGALEAAGSLGASATRSVSVFLVGVVEGVKNVVGAALPQSLTTSAAKEEEPGEPVHAKSKITKEIPKEKETSHAKVRD